MKGIKVLLDFKITLVFLFLQWAILSGDNVYNIVLCKLLLTFESAVEIYVWPNEWRLLRITLIWWDLFLGIMQIKFCVLFSLLSANKYLPNRETNVIFAQYNPPTPTLIISPGS